MVSESVFLFIIDVVPSHGADDEEAKAIVLRGRAFELEKKFDNEIQDWTYDDTIELVSKMSWRARYFFPVRERLQATVEELQIIHSDTDQQPRDLGLNRIVGIRESLPNGKQSILEKIVLSQGFPSSIVAFSIMAFVFIYTANA